MVKLNYNLNKVCVTTCLLKYSHSPTFHSINITLLEKKMHIYSTVTVSVFQNIYDPVTYLSTIIVSADL